MSNDAFIANTPTLAVRSLRIDLSTPMRRHWNGGDAFLTAFFNALSFSFPEGEQFFIEAVRKSVKHLDSNGNNDALRQTVQGFIGQEANHRHLHAQYNKHIEAQGLKNHWGTRISTRKMRIRRILKRTSKCYLHELAITAGYEHITAVMGELVLESQGAAGDWLNHADTPIQNLWRWHSAEECEHKTVAFDLHEKLGGNHSKRIWWFAYISIYFTTDVIRQTINNLWHDRTLHKPTTWWSALKFCFGPHGIVWRFTPRYIAYFRKDFHPNQLGDANLVRDWLQAHDSELRIISKPQS